MGFDTPVARTPAQSVGEQILDSMQASIGRGDRQVLVRLNPPELGTVLVRFQEQGDRVSAMMEVASREVRREIEQALPQVVRTLQEAGVQIRRVEVVTSDQPERDLGREQLPQDTWSQPQQDSGQNREHLYASPQGRWARGATNHGAGREEGPGDESRAAASQGRIDMLL
jgi:flagellar hook-length control protein FliK